jgi:suppressor for copper-sensitivity B
VRGVFRGLIVGAAVLLAAGAGHAQGAGPWTDYGQGRVRLVSASTSVTGDQALLGLHYVIAKGWEIYWRSPGQAGLPTTVDWQESENLRVASLRWPLPRRFKLLGIENYGYKDEVVLPVVAELEHAGGALKVRADVHFLTCNEVCVPQNVRLTLDLPGGPGGLSPHAALLNRFQARVPRTDVALGLSLHNAEAVAARGGEILRVTARSAVPFVAPDVYVEGPPDFVFAAPRVELSGDGREAVMEVAVTHAATMTAVGSVSGRPLTLTLVDGERAAEVMAVPTPGSRTPGDDLSFALILLIALAGGLILNVMPCVLPVLAMKLVAAVGHTGADRGTVRLSFVASAAGILAAFLALAAALGGLRAGGAAIGWGFQFQDPLFVATMAVVVTLFAANLWGLFAIRLPAWLGDRAGRSETPGWRGAFASGVFATILATPCSAPFVGTAVGFALSRGPLDIVAIFAVMALGMALPFLVVAGVPGLVAHLPRPGRWMEIVRRVMALALWGTALWLASVLAAQVSERAAVVLAIALVAMTAAIGLARIGTTRLKRWAAAAAIALGLAGILLPALSEVENVETAFVDGRWQRFDEAAIPGHVAAGRIVFVDVTADWCVTCKANKRLVLDRGAVAGLLGSDRVVAMRADWTRPDDRIARYLESFRRFGIPFNAVYGRQAPNGIALPELLSEQAVLAALRGAGGLTLAEMRR